MLLEVRPVPGRQSGRLLHEGSETLTAGRIAAIVKVEKIQSCAEVFDLQSGRV